MVRGSCGGVYKSVSYQKTIDQDKSPQYQLKKKFKNLQTDLLPVMGLVQIFFVVFPILSHMIPGLSAYSVAYLYNEK